MTNKKREERVRVYGSVVVKRPRVIKSERKGEGGIDTEREKEK